MPGTLIGAEKQAGNKRGRSLPSWVSATRDDNNPSKAVKDLACHMVMVMEKKVGFHL